jgi:hypothetical protein
MALSEGTEEPRMLQTTADGERYVSTATSGRW